MVKTYQVSIMGIRYVVMVQSSDQFNTVAIDVKVTAKTITSLMESIIFTSVNIINR